MHYRRKAADTLSVGSILALETGSMNLTFQARGGQLGYLRRSQSTMDSLTGTTWPFYSVY